MEIRELREQLQILINTSSEEKLREVYSLFEDEYSDEFKAELDEEYANYKVNGEVLNRKDVKKAIEHVLYGKNNA